MANNLASLGVSMADLAQSDYVFAYGSLIWRPDFKFVDTRRTWLAGFERRFWQASHDHRGTPCLPGRVVTLVPVCNGQCEGVAYRLPPEQRESILHRLDEREQDGYVRTTVQVVDSKSGEKFTAITWLASSSNPSWVGNACNDEIAAIIASRQGPSGSNREYLMKLHEVFARMGITDNHVDDLVCRVNALSQL